MKELTLNEYHRVLPLIDRINFDVVFANSIIEKKQLGKVLVDNSNNPSITFIYHQCGAALLCGTDKNGVFEDYLIDLLLRNKSIDQKQVRIIVHPEIWNEKLRSILGNQLIRYSDYELNTNLDSIAIKEKLNCLSEDHIIAWTRVKFDFVKEKYVKVISHANNIPRGYTLKKIDQQLYERITGSIVPSTFWDSAEAFLQNGIGFCILKDDDTVVSAGFSAYIDSGKIDIGIETTPEYRGQGFATIACIYMIEYCLDNEYEPIWGCRKDNIGSRQLARKLGFEEKIHHPTYWALSSPPS